MNKELLEKVSYQILNHKKLKSGFYALDCYLQEVETGSVITIGGRPSIDKSALAYSIMLNLLKQKSKCLLFSMYRSDTQVVKFLISQESEVIITRILFGGLLSSDKPKIKDTINKFLDYKLIIDDETPAPVTIEYIKEKIVKEKPKYVFIDYFQWIKGIEMELATNISRELKNIAKENNCIIYVLSELSSAIENRVDKRPFLSDFEDNTLVEFSDVVMLMYRDCYDKDNDEVDTSGDTEIIIAKNKFGQVGSTNLLYKSHIEKFIDPIICNTF